MSTSHPADSSTPTALADRGTPPSTASEQPRRGLTSRVTGELRTLAPALAGYLAVRAIGLVVLAAWTAHRGQHLSTELAHRSDAVWYLNLIRHGYDSGRGQSNMAFFPLYPGLVRVLHLAVPVGVGVTATAVAWLSAVAAAAALYKIGAHLRDPRTGVLLAVLWGVLPHAVVESMAYTEALFTALAAWSLYALLRRRWVTAGVLCLLAGLTRPTAVALIAVVTLTSAIAILRRTGGWRPWTALVLAPAGWIGYLAWVAHRTGRGDGWFHIQSAGWHMSWDNGAYTASVLRGMLDRASALDYYLVAAVLLISIGLLVLMMLDRVPWQLTVYSGLVLLSSVGAEGYFNAKARFLIPAIGLLIPIAVSLAKTTTAKAVTVVATLTAISAWCGGYLLLIWPYSP